MNSAFLKWILPFLPAGLLALGQSLQGRDNDSKGADDVLGRAIVTLGPVVTLALSDPSGTAALRALRAANEGIAFAIRELEAAEDGK